MSNAAFNDANRDTGHRADAHSTHGNMAARSGRKNLATPTIRSSTPEGAAEQDNGT